VILLGILAGGGWWGWKSLVNSSAEQTCVQQKLANNRLVPKQVVLNVYNGGARAGSAQRVADVLKKRGFNIGKVSNEPKGNKVRSPNSAASPKPPPNHPGSRPAQPKSSPGRRRPHRPHRRPGHRRRLRSVRTQGHPLSPKSPPAPTVCLP